MRDLYAALGIAADSTQEAIKRAYRHQARLFHPDVGGSHERMTVINQAYATLSNPEARHQFDQRRAFFQDDETGDNANVSSHERLSASGVPYSHAFKAQHRAFTQQSSQSPLTAFAARNHFNPLGPKRYQRKVLAPLFDTLVTHLEEDTSALSQQCCYALLEIRSVKNPSSAQNLNAIYWLTQYAASLTELPIPLLNLFQHEHFRLLFQAVVQDYWCDHTFFLDKNILQSFDGRARTHAFLEQLKTTVTNRTSAIPQGLKNFIQAMRLLRQFETDLRKDDTCDRSAQAYREAAYTVLDWVPAFAGKMPTGLMSNLLMQAGLYFQCASQVEKIPALQMADEKLAQDLYVSTFNVGHHATPDVELYHLMHGLKYLGAFRYTDPTLPLLIKAFQHRAFLLADVFPFYQPPVANIHFLVQEDQPLRLMRQLLQQLVAHLDTHDPSSSAWVLDHPEAVIRYRAYEACVKGWYEKTSNPETEETLRVTLMHTLLADRGLDFSEVRTPDLKRDNQAWLQSFSMLNQSNTSVRNFFSSIDGFEVDYKQGRFTLLATPCNQNTPDCFRSLHVSDLTELFQKNIDAAMFSLDPVDPDMDYHPFNALWFKPERLYQTVFLDTLLATDYILKFLTVGQEVQGAYPFGQRSLDKLTQHLPEYLKQIIDDFHAAQQSESLHRFWIEAESLPITIEDKALASQGIQTFHLYDVNMQVKKHVLERDPAGKLIDAAEHPEGWFFYVLTNELKRAFDKGRSHLQEPAMLFLLQGSQVFFSEAGERSTFALTHYDEPLAALRRCERDKHGKVLATTDSSELMYRITREVERQAGKPHHFSPEYIFAQEFTAHYEEFALYFPEFKRLQELSRVVVLIRVLNGVRESNQTALSLLNKELAAVQQWQNHKTFPKDSEDKQKYEEAYTETLASVNQNFSTWRQQLNYDTIVSQKKSEYRDLREKVGSLSVLPYSSEVNAVCQKMYDDTERYYGGYGCVDHDAVWQQIDAERSNIASRLSSQKRSQVWELFSSVASGATIIGLTH